MKEKKLPLGPAGPADESPRVADAIQGSLVRWEGRGGREVVARSAGVGESGDACSDSEGEGD